MGDMVLAETQAVLSEMLTVFALLLALTLRLDARFPGQHGARISLGQEPGI